MLTLPTALSLPEAEDAPTFNKVVYFESNLRTIAPRNVSASMKEGGRYALNVTIDLLLGEIIKFNTAWTAKALKAGNYSVSILASSIDADVDARFRVAHGAFEIQVVDDAPVIGELEFYPPLNPIDFNPQKMYASPGQEIEVMCNVTSFSGIRNVTLYYSIEPNGVWNECLARRRTEREWVATIPGQIERVSLVFYVKAFSMLGISSKTREYGYISLDMRAMELRTYAIGTLTAATIVVGCLLIFMFKRRGLAER